MQRRLGGERIPKTLNLGDHSQQRQAEALANGRHEADSGTCMLVAEAQTKESLSDGSEGTVGASGGRLDWASEVPGLICEPDAFDCVPVAQLQRMLAVLRGEEPKLRVVLLACFYSVELYNQLVSRGDFVIQCDYRFAEGPACHFKGNIQQILHRRWWGSVVAAPPCKNTSWATASLFPEKQADGRQFAGIHFALQLWCAPADAVLLEQSRGELSRFLGPPSQILHPKHLKGGQGEVKTTCLWCRGHRAAIPLDGELVGEWRRSALVWINDADEREIERARWSSALAASVARLCGTRAVVEGGPGQTARPYLPALLLQLARRWVRLGRPLPEWWADEGGPPVDEAQSIAQFEDGTPRRTPGWMRQQQSQALLVAAADTADEWDLADPNINRWVECRHGAVRIGGDGGDCPMDCDECVRAECVCEARNWFDKFSESVHAMADNADEWDRADSKINRRVECTHGAVRTGDDGGGCPLHGNECVRAKGGEKARSWFGNSAESVHAMADTAVEQDLADPKINRCVECKHGAARIGDDGGDGPLDCDVCVRARGEEARNGFDNSAESVHAMADTAVEQDLADPKINKCVKCKHGAARIGGDGGDCPLDCDECVRARGEEARNGFDNSAESVHAMAERGVEATVGRPPPLEGGEGGSTLPTPDPASAASTDGVGKRTRVGGKAKVTAASGSLTEEEEMSGVRAKGKRGKGPRTAARCDEPTGTGSQALITSDLEELTSRPISRPPPASGAGGRAKTGTVRQVVVVPVSLADAANPVALLPRAKGAVLAVDGGAVSRTEAKQLALLALRGKAPELQVEHAFVCQWRELSVVIGITMAEPAVDSRAEDTAALKGGAQRQALTWARASAFVDEGAKAELVASCLLRVAQLQSPQPGKSGELRTGASTQSALAPSVAGDAGADDFAKRVLVAKAADEELALEFEREAERLESGSTTQEANEEAECLRLWATRTREGASEPLPGGAAAACRRFDDAGLATCKFVRRCPITEVKRPSDSQEEKEPPPVVSCVEDVLTREALKRITDKLQQFARWHAKMLAWQRGGCEDPEPRRPKALALGVEAFQPGMHRWVWDLQGDVPVAAKMEGVPVEGQLRRDALVELLSDCVDKELLHFVEAGVTTKADIGPQIVIVPNLLSLYSVKGGVDGVADEYAELMKREWYKSTGFIPFAPWRCNPRGAVPRADGGPPRGIADAGAPRGVGDATLYTIPEHEEVVPVNVASREVDVDGHEQWEKEAKPRFEDAAKTGAILRLVADLSGKPVYIICCDLKYFFHCLIYRNSELWKCGALLPQQREGGGASAQLRATTERVMAMGFTASSQIAQRLANAMMQLFARTFEAEEEPFNARENAATRGWLEARRALGGDEYGSQARLFEPAMYTDDPIIQVVGAKRAVRAVRLFYRLFGPPGANFEWAKPSKWHAGCRSKWLGGGLAPMLGVAWVPLPKALDAAGKLRRAREGELDRAEWRRLLGLCEHLRQLLKSSRKEMRVLWRQLAGVSEDDEGPAAIVVPDQAGMGVLRTIEARMLEAPCASLLEFVRPKDVRRYGAGQEYRLSSDAALEPDVDFLDMGGVFYGKFWYLAVKGVGITIPVGEFLALGIEVIMFAEELENATNVVIETDALATWWALTKEHAKSGSMAAVLDALVERVEYRRLCAPAGRTTVCHTFGEGNVLADMASRAMFEGLTELFRLLGMKASRVAVPEVAQTWVLDTLGRMGIDASIVPGRGGEQPATIDLRRLARARRERRVEEDGERVHPHPGMSASSEYGDDVVLEWAVGQKRELELSIDVDDSPVREQREREPCGAVVARGGRNAPYDWCAEEAGVPPESPPPGGPAAEEGTGAAATLESPPLMSLPEPETKAPMFPHEAEESASPALAAARGTSGDATAGELMRAGLEREEESARAAESWEAASESEKLCLITEALGELECAKHWHAVGADPGEADTIEMPRWNRGNGWEAARIRAAAMEGLSIREITAAKLRVKAEGLAKGSVQRKFAELRSAERVRRALSIAERLRADESEYALRFESEEEQLEAISEFVAALDEQNAEGTIVNEASNWKHWLAFCDHFQTAVWRRRPFTPGDDVHKNEVFGLAQALLFIYSRMQPRKGWSSPPRPASAVNVLRGVRRTHLRLGLQFPELTEIVKVANSLTATYVEKYYPGGLLPQRAEPMHNDEIKRLLEFVSPSAKATVRIGGRVERTGSRTVVSWRACVALLAQCGFRGSEVALGSGKAFGKVCINRASVTWRIGGVDVTDPTPEQLANLKVGDYVLIVPPPSKCDRFGIAWGSDPIYLAWHPTRPICAARELQQLELDFPVRGEEARRETPLFATNDGKMFVRTWLADSMKKALRACGVPSERVAVLTLHSYRRYLACCLLAANVSEAKICALLRWRSAKSLAAYATLNDKAYADMIDTAAEQAVSSIRTANIGRMPVTSHKEVALNMRRGAAGAEKAAAQTDDEAARAAVDDAGEA